MNGGECPRPGTGALLYGRSVERLGEDGALSHQNNVFATEFLLKLTDESRLDLVVVLQLTERDEDDDSLAAAIKLKLLSSRYVQIAKIRL